MKHADRRPRPGFDRGRPGSRGSARRTLASTPLLACLLGACASSASQLENVARDWSMTIRASQVVPVYPLTEDLQPGDVFLVQLPIDRQQEIYRRKGFLPLDNHVVRMDPEGYAEFYGRAFRQGFGDGPLPRSQQRPSQGRSWSEAPETGFPSYSFSVRQGSALTLALPIQGVPVGLGLMGSRAADGSVSLKQARTLGVDTVSLYAQLQEWARGNRAFLAHFGAEPPRNHLRVVSRIYLAGQVDVSIRNAEEAAAGADAGQSSPLALLAPQPPGPGGQAAAAEGYANALEKINAAIGSALSAVGGTGLGTSLRITAASARSVSLTETFDPPLVFGYLGFDVSILPGGDLGPPIPTHANLTNELSVQHSPELARTLDLSQAAVTRRVYLLLHSIAATNAEAAERVQALDALAALLPEKDTFYQTQRGDVLVAVPWTPDPQSPPYLRFHDWQGKMELSRRVLSRLLAGDKLRMRTGDAEPVELAKGSDEWQVLARALESFDTRRHDAVLVGRLQEASRAAWRTFYRLASEEEAR